MSLAPRLEARQSQSLAMTPQLQQAIKLLQLSHQELQAFVEAQVLENPLLDLGEAEGEGGAPVPEGTLEDTATLVAATTITADTGLDVADSSLWDASNDLPAIDSAPWQESSGMVAEEDFTERLSGNTTLAAHLEAQFGTLFIDSISLGIARYVTDCLDAAGYLTTPLEEIAETLGCTVGEIEGVLLLLQKLEPAGVYARDLAECLRLQLIDRDLLTSKMEILLKNLPLLAENGRQKLERLCKVTSAELATMLATLKTLNPKPAACFDWREPETLIPDVYARQNARREWQVELNPETLPKLLINQQYKQTLEAGGLAKPEKQYLQSCQQSADWLARALHQRATTTLGVATAILERQQDFFQHGVRYLKPMVLRDLAATLKVHESTISRIVSSKYIATPRGTFELKYFFTSGAGVQSAFGDTVSSQAVKHSIAAMIQKESPAKPLSDEQLVARLKAEGIDIARRTVAKYREALGIPSSSDRRRAGRA